MTRYLNKLLCVGLWAICALFCSPVFAEGSKQLSPILNGDTSIVMLNTNLDTVSNFAAYNGPVVSRLNIRIQTNDTIYIGLSREYQDSGLPDGLGGAGRYCFRIKNPAGTVVHGPFEIDVNNANADSWLLATSGPDVLGDPNGYDTQTEPYARFIPASTGDYYIEFSDNLDCSMASSGDVVNIKFFDITVKNIVEKPGRLWSRNWGFISPAINPSTPPECQFDRSFNGTLFSYTTDGFVSKIDFDSSGFQGLNFTVAFGERGPRNTGDVLIDRQSVNNADSTANAADHMVFINEPDETEFPSSQDVCGEIELFSVQCVADTFCFNVGITRPGQIEIILDFSGDGEYTMDTNDVIIAVILDQADTVCLSWNGLKGDGSSLAPGESLPAIIRYSQGVQHYAAYDVEFLKFGFCVETIRPICPGISTDLLYWDDSNIADDMSTVLYDESDPGTGQPAIELNGCTCQTMGCRTWTNAHVDADTTCTGVITGYGDRSTLNTWWFASTTIMGPLDLPFVTLAIVGDTSVCSGDSTELTAMGSPDTLNFIYEWMGPNGFMAMTQSTGQIADPGTYYVTITDTVSNCSAVDSAILVVLNSPETSITFMCIPNQPNANVDLTVMGNGPFMYMWSNSAMTEDLMNVGPGTYFVTVTDVNNCQAIDSVTVEECCVFDIVCPPMDGGQFSCIDSIPAQDSTAVIVNDFCEPLMIDIMDEEISEAASGCIGDTIFIQRTYTVTDGGGGSSICVQIFTVVDDVPPMITCPPNITVDCDAGIDPALTGSPTISDNCTIQDDLTLSFIDDGTPGPCDGTPVTRTWTVTDACNNTATCVQLITVQDTVPPEVTMASCPADITVDCDNPEFEFLQPIYTDNCTDDQQIVVTTEFDSLGFDGTCTNFAVGIINITFYAEDICGNIDSSCVLTVTVQDTVPPQISAPEDIELDCNDDQSPANTGEVTDTTDNCTSITVTFMDIPALAVCPDPDTLYRVWTATDACGNSSSDVQRILLVDNDPPTYTTPPDITIDCSIDPSPANTGEILDTMDVCGSEIMIDFDDETTPGNCDGESTIQRTWTVSDICGNSSTDIQIITLIDTTGPMFTIPSDTMVDCTEDPGQMFGSPGPATDDCSSVGPVTFTDLLVPGECPATDTLYRTWMATDDCENTTTMLQTIVFIDTTGPTFTVPMDVTLECDQDPTDLQLTGDVTDEEDDCSTATVDFTDDDSGLTGCNGTGVIIRTWTATDECENTTTQQQQITIEDTTPPVAACMDVTIDFGIAGEIILSPDMVDAGSSDNCGDVTLTLSDSVFVCTEFLDQSTIVIQLIVTDECGLTDMCDVMVTGIGGGGLQIECPDDIVVNLGPGQCEAIVNYEVTASSLCGGPGAMITIEQVDDSGLTSGDAFPIGVTVQEYIAYNTAGDTVSCSFTITVIEAPSDPFLVCNDTVRITLDPQCQAIINPDIILEGGTFGCFDDFYICVAGIGCDSGEVVITDPDLGCYTVTITNEFGNTCWGIACFEDKLPPMITCEDVTVDCTESTDPSLYEPTASDACSEVTLDYTEEETGELCENIIITRTWTATDESGNTATCVQTITVTPLTLDGLEFPGNYQGICGESSHPDNTGWPTLDGVEIEDFLCNIFLTWWDHPLADCGGGTKIIRTWTVLDWCTLELVEGTQIIKLTDEQGPVLDCPDEIVEGTDPWFCHTDVDIWIDATDICGSYPLTYTVSINGGVNINLGVNPHYKIIDLPLGSHTATWTVTDACGNKSTCTSTIIVEDDIEPVAVCDEHTILSLIFEDLLNEGLTKLHAESLDDGSYDNCSEELIFLARRMPPPLPNPFQPSCIDFDWISNSIPYMEYPDNDGGPPEAIDLGYTFQPWVPFACCDVGKTVLVEFMVTDEAGNTNTCMVQVEVQDKLKPIIHCPPDITVGCEFWFEAHETNGFVPADGLEHVFGRVVDDKDDRLPIIINDPSPGSPYYLQDHLWGYDGWADDNCDVTITVDTDIDDDCSGEALPGNAPENAVRLIRRTFRATDGSGNRETCTQRIWVVDYDRFEIYDEVCGLWPTGDDVRWPCDLNLTDCPDDTSPEGLSAYAPNNAPLVRDDNCSIIGVTYDDQIFYFIDGACFKIIRTWTIIDWCQFESDGHGGFEGYWQYVQVIKVNDHQGAEFLDCPPEPVTLCIEDEGVTLPSNNQVFLGESNPNSSACSAHVLITHDVYEGCSDAVIYDVKFYPHNGSEFIQVQAKTTVPVDEDNQAVLTFNTQQNSLPSSHAIRRNGLPYNDKYCSNYPSPGGTKDYHRLLWTVEDGCGNITTCSYLLRIEDCKKPTPICVGLSSVVMPNSGSVTIWAADFDSGSSVDDCTAHEDLLFSFSGETYQPGREFNCDIIADNGSPTFIVEIWVADEGNDQNCDGVISWSERNKDYCTTFITIDDNEDVCPGGVGVAGRIETHELHPVELVRVDMMDPGAQVMNSYVTDKDGYYSFTNPLIDYIVEPKRNDNHKNGVSTLDLVEIQKHLLGIRELSSPYKMIAADANNSESVSALDLVEIRKLILGLYVEFPNNKSWRFVDAGFEFDNPVSPWPFAEHIVIGNGMTGHEDFVAVKIGDVNGTVIANAGQVQTRGARKVLYFEVEDRDIRHGEIIDIPVTAQNFNDILGFQFTLESGGLDFTGVTSGAIAMRSEFIAEHKDAITMSWLDLEASAGSSSVARGEVFFTLHFTATSSGKLSDLLQITSAITEAEAYSNLEASVGSSSVDDVALLDIALTFGQALPAADPDFALYQNEPNPFSDQTVIGFDLPAAMPATLTVYDMHGRIIRKIEDNYGQGYNEITLRAKELRVAGAYYYRLNAGDFTASKRLLLTRE